MSQGIDHRITCPECEEEIEITIHPGCEAILYGPNAGPSEPPYFDPEECECGWVIEVEDAGEIYQDYKIGAEEDAAEAAMELRREREAEGW